MNIHNTITFNNKTQNKQTHVFCSELIVDVKRNT